MSPSDTTPQYTRIDRPPFRWTVRRDFQRIIGEPVFTAFEKFIETAHPHVVTRSKSKTTIITPLDSAGAGREFIIKNYRLPRLYQRLRSMVHRTVAVKELRVGLEIERRGIPVAVPVAIAERRSLGMVNECFVVVERLPGRMDLEDCLLTPDVTSLPKEKIAERRQVVRKLAELVKQLHRNGIYQYDCNLCNFLLHPETLSLTFIDLAKVGMSSSLPRHRRVDNLAKLMRHRLRVPATDAMRFLREYVGGGRDKRRERRGLAAEVSRANFRLLHRQFVKETEDCLREGRNFQSLKCAECTAIFRKRNYTDYLNGERFLADLLHAAQGAIQASARHGTSFRCDIGGGEDVIWVFEGRYMDLEFTWRERNGLYPAGAWEDFPLGLCKMTHPPERGMLFLIPAAPYRDGQPFLELSHAERFVLDEISGGVEGFGQD